MNEVITYKNFELIGLTDDLEYISKEKNGSKIWFDHDKFFNKQNLIYVYDIEPRHYNYGKMQLICTLDLGGYLNPSSRIWKMDDSYSDYVKNEDEERIIADYLKMLNGDYEITKEKVKNNKSVEVVIHDLEEIFGIKRKNTKKKKKKVKKQSLEVFEGQISMLD